MGRWGLVAVAIVVVLAGCGAATRPPGTQTVSPAPVPSPDPSPTAVPTATQSRTATASPSVPFPPGVTVSGITNVSALARAHRSTLSGGSYRAVSVVNRSTAAGWERTQRVVHVEGERAHLRRRTHESGGNRSTLVEYRDGEGRYPRCAQATHPRNCPATPSVVSGDSARTVLSLLSGTQSRVDGRDRSTGAVRHRLVVSGTPFGIGSPYGVVEVTNYSATALVAPSGLVTELAASYDLVAGESRVNVTVRMYFTDVGATRVTPPPWHRPTPTTTVGNGTA